MMAITPITTVANTIPYLGVVLTLGWALFLIVIASEEVHKIKAKTAWTVFGPIFIIFALMSIGSQSAARKINAQVAPWTEKIADMEEMSPEEAGRMVGQFLKGLEGATGKQ